MVGNYLHGKHEIHVLDIKLYFRVESIYPKSLSNGVDDSGIGPGTDNQTHGVNITIECVQPIFYTVS